MNDDTIVHQVLYAGIICPITKFEKTVAGYVIFSVMWNLMR